MKYLKQGFNIIVAIFLIEFAVRMLLAPHKIAAGGVGGIATIIDYLYNINMATTTLVLNVSLLIIGALLLGKDFFVKTAFATLIMPIFAAIIPKTAIANNVLFCAIVGGALIGIGVHMLYINNASNGGTSTPPLIFKKYFNLPESIGLFLVDGLVMVASYFTFGLASFLYAIIVLATISLVVEVLAKLNQKTKKTNS